MEKKLITVVTPCRNEEGNVSELYQAIAEIFRVHPKYQFEHLFIDNASSDGTEAELRKLAQEHSNVRVILNTRNFGHIRSPYHALTQAQGDAAILISSDFQDPPDLIPKMLEAWENGSRVALAIKETSTENRLVFALRQAYYSIVNRLADCPLYHGYTGFGLFDRAVLEELRKVRDPYPYLRGLIAELGFPALRIPFRQPPRKRGKTKNGFYSLYDLAMLGITSHSRVPLRLAALLGFGLSLLSLMVAVSYLLAKLLFWDFFTVGTAPIIISLFFFASIQLFFIGILGEYIGSIHTHVQRRPRVIERERIGFPS